MTKQQAIHTLESLIHTCKSYNPRVRGCFIDTSGLTGVRSNGLIVWLAPDDYGYRETGTTETAECAQYVRFEDMED